EVGLSLSKEVEIYELIKEPEKLAFLTDPNLLIKETFMTRGDTHEHENKKVFSYQKVFLVK
ncbi:MAG: hypothetical protein N2V75_08385, partial [Methanophagales archaeon]|nr:hypothetical protein [Methanophagales archaeon]